MRHKVSSPGPGRAQSLMRHKASQPQLLVPGLNEAQQRLRQVGLQVGHGLQADREAHQRARQGARCRCACRPGRRARPGSPARPRNSRCGTAQRIDEGIDLLRAVARVEASPRTARRRVQVAPVRVAGRAGQRRVQHLRPPRPRAQPRASSRAACVVRVVAQRAWWQRAQHQFGVVGRHAQPSRMWVSLMRSCSASSRVTTEPISTSPPPEGYLVSACITMSMPRSKARRRCRRPRCCPARWHAARAPRHQRRAGRGTPSSPSRAPPATPAGLRADHRRQRGRVHRVVQPVRDAPARQLVRASSRLGP
jgi:hypothetical protein